MTQTKEKSAQVGPILKTTLHRRQREQFFFKSKVFTDVWEIS